MIDAVTGKRTYDDPCGLARAVELIGERWAVLVVRELLLGPKRFGDLSRGLPGMSQNVLAQRLRDLEQSGIVRRRELGPPAGAPGYELTDMGSELEPVLLAMARWGSRRPIRSTAELSVDAFVLALKTTFDSAAAGDLRTVVDLRIGADRFRAEIAGGVFTTVRGDAASADAVLAADTRTFKELVFTGLSIADAVQRGDLRLAGDSGMAAAFIASFAVPEISPLTTD
jgi:DNA-binding HxlR family transcriptional regulator